MFEMLRTQSRSASGAILYVTIGTLLMIWSGLYYYYFLSPPDRTSDWQNFACIGTILSGFAIASIGLLFGVIGRGAKAADTTIGAAPIGPMVAPAVVGTPGVPVAPMNGAPMTAAPMANAGYANPNR